MMTKASRSLASVVLMSLTIAMLPSSCSHAQLSAKQLGADTDYQFKNRDPAYDLGTGPRVGIDEAHFEFHTINGRFSPFADLLRGDGYRVTKFSYRFTRDSLKECQILVIANASAKVNSDTSKWSYPHPSAFSSEEIVELILWVKGGGSLLLVVDHAPWPGAAADLAVLLGVQMLDGFAYSSKDNIGDGASVFGLPSKEGWQEKAHQENLTLKDYRSILANPGELEKHPIISGRNVNENVQSVVTYVGHAFVTTDNWKPLLKFGPNAVSRIPMEQSFDESDTPGEPVFSVSGWLQGASRKLGRGRIVVLGEAAMCTAQLDEGFRWGINAPESPHNAQFCLNVMHWLSGLLDEENEP